MHLHKAYYGLALAVGTTALAVLVGNQTFWIAALMGSGVLALLGFQSERRANDAEALQRSPAPSIVFYPPRTDEHVPMAHGGTQPFAFGAVENRKPAPGSGVIGQKARLSLDFYEAETERRLFTAPITGRWRSAPSPLERNPLRTHPDAEAIDLHPNGTVYEFDLGTKAWSEGRWYAIDAEQALHDTHTKRARVLVTVEGSNFDPYVAEYFVESNGYRAGFTASLLSADEPPLTALGYPNSDTDGAGEGRTPPSPS